MYSIVTNKKKLLFLRPRKYKDLNISRHMITGKTSLKCYKVVNKAGSFHRLKKMDVVEL